jgi:hypothetical protein
VKVNRFAEYEICFGNSFHVKDRKGFNIKSSGFYVNDINDVVYIGDLPDDDLLNGDVFLFSYDVNTNTVTKKRTIGRINYEKGEINISAINIFSTLKSKNGRQIIEISAIPKSNDIIGLQDIYLNLSVNSINVDMISDTISSGVDISGSQHISSSSYSNGLLIRQ